MIRVTHGGNGEKRRVRDSEILLICRRLANRESARKMRRKHASLLKTGEAGVARLELEHDQYLAHLNEGRQKFDELETENELLKQELQRLLDLHVCYLPLEGLLQPF
jgi:cell shape-determining protein MreC